MRASKRNYSHGQEIHGALAMVHQISRRPLRDGAMVGKNDSQVFRLIHPITNHKTENLIKMKIANTVTYTTGCYQNQKMIIRPYKLTHEGARRILQAEAVERFDGEPCHVRVCVSHISIMTMAR